VRLEAQELSVALRSRPVLHAVSLIAPAGELTGLIGPNGAGKTTLLRAFAGLVRPAAGRATLDGTALESWERGALARALAYLPQERAVHWRLDARSVVALGRLPHRPFGTGESEADALAVAAALAAMDVSHLAARPVLEMSGGERARVLVARALAQEPATLLADEPTAGLDPSHQLALFRHFAALAAAGSTVLVALHDLSLAARFCHRLVMLHAGRVAAAGPPAEVLTEARLAAIYGVRARLAQLDGVPVVVPIELLP